LIDVSLAEQHVPQIALSPELQSRLREQQVATILGHSAVAGVLSTVFAGMIAVFLEPAFGEILVKGWFAIKASSALPRVLLALAYRSTSIRARLAGSGLLLYSTIAVDGVVWGLAGFVGAHTATDVASVLIACLAIVATVATLGLQVRLLATGIFVTPILTMCIGGLIIRNDSFGFFASAGLALLLLQLWYTSFTTQRRLAREFMSREQLSLALKAQRDTAQQLAETGEQLKRQSAVKSMFLGTMSHELRTPLHGILGVTSMMTRDTQNAEQAYRLGIIQAQGQHLLGLIGALLDVSRIETGRLELQHRSFNLTKEVGDLGNLYTERTRETSVSFVLERAIPPNCWVSGDPARVRQVLHNLLGNAVKFTKSGLIKLTVSRSDDGKTVFAVADTGPGISADDQREIFEAFRQAAGPAARPEAGAGLGLTIARELARAMAGDVTVESVLGVGSRFEFRAALPAADPLQVIEPADVSAESRPFMFSGYTVLLAEDNDVNALIAEATLKRLGVQFKRATSGTEAVIAATDDARPHLVLMDLHMPGMDGLAAAREIRRREAVVRLSRVPIVALTANSSSEDMLASRNAGMDGFLSKPFTEADLSLILASHLGPGIPVLADENDDLGSDEGETAWRRSAFH
jgi:signal transduction histidine kinase/ActR/RegA family two-component response regulator